MHSLIENAAAGGCYLLQQLLSSDLCLSEVTENGDKKVREQPNYVVCFCFPATELLPSEYILVDMCAQLNNSG